MKCATVAITSVVLIVSTAFGMEESLDTSLIKTTNLSIFNYNFDYTVPVLPVGRQIEFPSFYTVDGANLNQPCNLKLYEEYILPMYRAIDRESFLIMYENLVNYISDSNNWPNNATALQPLSCFTFKFVGQTPVVRYMDCVADPAPGSTGHVCNCSTQEPYKSHVNTYTQECEMDEPEVGTPCLHSRSEYLKDLFYNDMRKGIAQARTSQHVIDTLNVFIRSVSNYIFALSIPGDIRLACFNLKNHKPRQFIDFNKENLECSPAGKCQCIWHSSSRMQYLDYQGKCYAEHGAICKLEAEERNTDYDQSDGRMFVFSDTICRSPKMGCGKINGILFKKGTKVSATSCGGTGQAKGSVATPEPSTALTIFATVISVIMTKQTPQDAS